MMRLFTAGVLAVGVAGAGVAKPPIEWPVQGKERSPIEIDLYVPERTTPPETVPTMPRSGGDVVSAVLVELRAIVSIQLGTVPLIRPVMW